MADPVRLGPFEVVERIGAGGMGEVYRAVHAVHGLAVAVKVLTEKRAFNPAYIDAFRREVRAVAALEHPNIVVVFDYGEVTPEAETGSGEVLTAGSPYLALELCDKGTISDRRGRIPWLELRAILLDLLDALGHAHARGVIHRDLKPGNVLIGSDGVKLTDFGLAHILGPEAEGGQPRGGTPAYMAPEQFQGNTRQFGPWTDLYAFGCLAWTLAAGRPPFPGRRWVNVMRAQASQPPPPLRPRMPVPKGFENWLRQLLRKAPEQRFRWAADAAYALRQLPDELEPITEEIPDDDAPAQEISTLLLHADGPTTTLLPTDGGEGRNATAEDPHIDDLILDEPVHRAPPPFPRSWRSSGPLRPRPRSAALLGVGLGLYGLRSVPLVDREEERGLLWSGLETVFAGRGARTVLLSGPMGCGKSRLARWLCERAHEAGAATILRAVHGPEGGAGDGLGPMLARHFRTAGLDHEALGVYLHRRLAAMGSTDTWLWRGLAEVIEPSGDVRFVNTSERYSVIYRALALIAESRPLVIWADDVQWGHELLNFVRYAMQIRPSAPLFFVLTAQDAALVERPAEQVRLEMVLQMKEAARIDVGPLSQEHTAALVRELLFLEGDLAERVIERVDGNPLFAVQLVGDWVQRGLLVPTDRGFSLQDGARVDLPDDLHQVWRRSLQRVLARLPGDALKSLQLASLLGVEVDASEWASACHHLDCPFPREVVEPLIEGRLLRRSGAGWAFEHGMLRESPIRWARDDDWAALHLAIATALSETPDGGEAARVGRHFYEAGRWEEAMAPLLDGARAAMALSDYRLARDLLDLRATAMDELGLAADHRERVRGWLVRVRLYVEAGRPLEALEWSEKAENAVRDSGDDGLTAKALQRRALVLEKTGDLDDAERYYLAARSLFKRAGVPKGLGDCLVGLGRIHEQRGRHGRAREVIQQAIEAFDEADSPLQRAHCLEELARSARHSGDFDEAEALLDEALPAYDQLGARSGAASCLFGLAMVETGRGRLEEARRYNRQAMHLYEQLGDPRGMQACWNGYGELARFEGRLDEAEAAYRRALALAEEHGVAESVYPRVNLGLVLLQQDRFAEARVQLAPVVDDLEAAGRRGLAGGANVALMAACAGDGALEAFQDHFRRGSLLLEATGTADRDCAWPAELAAEQLAMQDEEVWARACWELALAQYEALKMRDEVARIKALFSG